ncbi:MAG: hypothetical protein H5T96_09795 [Tissierellales bacterium]|nr:hypothetical protein [Tissierellales bacterium]
MDFDGTCVTHEFPRIGKDIGAVPVLKEIAKSHDLILFTMRSDNRIDGTDLAYHPLSEAVSWFKENDIPLYGININPTQEKWTKSPKAYGQLYIDDAALGCPLKEDLELSHRPFVDWEKVEQILKEAQII